MFKKTLIAAAAVTVFSGAALADGYYGAGANYMMGDIDGVSIDLGAASLRAGSTIGDMAAIEGRVLIGVLDYDYGLETVSLDTVFTGLVKIGPNEGDIRPYAGVGFSRASITISGPYGSVSDSDTDVSFVAGASFYSDNKDGPALNVEYAQYYDKNYTSLSGLSIGMEKSF